MNSPWFPISPCGPDCVAQSQPTVPRAQVYFRIVAVVLTLLGAIVTSPFLALVGERTTQRWTQEVCRGILRAFGIRLEIHGEFAVDKPALVVNNHVSWLDIVLVNAVHPMRALGKSEVAEWPIVGMLAKRIGSIFLDRDALSTLPRTIGEVTDVLRSGAMVNVTPEATTWCGMASGKHRPASYQAAVDTGAPIIPFAVRYRLADGSRTTWPAFVGDETLMDALMRTAKLRGLVIEVHLLDPIEPGDANRRELATITERRMRTVLEEGLPDSAAKHATAIVP